jgi:protein ImuB
VGRIVPPGAQLAHIGPLPVAALRIGAEAVAALNGLGLRRIADVAVLPRAPLAQRIGPQVAERLDQALGLAPEPVSPARADQVFSLRLTLPEPIGREADVLAGIDRLLPPLCERLRAAGQGVLRLRLTLVRTDGRAERREVGLARAADRAEAIRPLLALKLGGIDAGFGIEVMRLAALAVEPVGPRQHRGPLAGEEPEALADLIGRLGARLGLEALTRLHPAESHIPEKGDTVMGAGFSQPAPAWPPPAAPRPVLLFPPEPIAPQDDAMPPRAFVWRRRLRRRAAAFGPERIAPEWWLDDPAWRSGPRDYWRVETEEGERLWIYEARGGEVAAGWFAQGVFA